MPGPTKNIHRAEVIYRNPMAWRFRLFVTIVLGLVLVVAGFYLGAYDSYQRYQKPAEESYGLRQRLIQQEVELERMSQQLANAQTAVEVDEAALELVRKDLAAHKQEIAELAEGVRFYKSLMAPLELEQGLMVGDLSISRTDTPQRFQMRLIIQQIVAKHVMLTGSASVEIQGKMKGKTVNLPLSQLLYESPGDNFKLRFKYFQAIDGVFTLPKGFEVENIEVRADVVKPRVAAAERQFTWIVED
jgi:hypothetical protein